MHEPWYKTAKWRVFLPLGLSYFVVVLSTALAFLLLSPIADHFGVSLAAVGWVVIIEGLVIAALLLPVGGLADSLGRRRVLVGGLALFAAGSIFTGLAPSFALLITGRLVMSFGNTMIQAVGTGLVVAAFPPEERGIAMGAQTTAVAVGGASGPLLGGFLLRFLDWNTLFHLLAIPTVIAIVAALIFLPDDADDLAAIASDRFEDYGGAVLSAAAVVVLIVLISNPFSLALTSVVTLFGAAAFVVLAATFVRWELRHRQPMMQLRLFENGPFRMAVVLRFFGFISSAAPRILLPVFLLSVRGASNVVTGLVLALSSAGIGVSAQVAGRLYDRIGPRLPSIAGLIVQAASCVGLAFATTSAPVWVFMVLAFVFGCGQSQWNVTNNSVMMGATSRQSLGVVGAFTNLARTLGSVVGQALAASVVAGVMARQGFDIPLGDVTDVPGATTAFVDGWTLAFLLSAALLAAAGVIGLRLPHGRPEELAATVRQ